jgi:hypothetical protein
MYYGNRNSTELLRTYGFTLPDLPADYYSLPYAPW